MLLSLGGFVQKHSIYTLTDNSKKIMLTVVFIEYFEKSKKNVICSSIIWNAVCVLEMPQGNVNRMSANVTRTVQVQPGTKWESCQRAARYRMWGRVKKSGTHLPLVSSERLERHPARVAPHLGSVVVRSRQQEMAIGGCTRKEGRKETFEITEADSTGPV